MEKIKETLGAVLCALEKKKASLPSENPEDIIPKILEQKELPHVEFHGCRGGVLFISVDSTGWMFQLGMKKNELLEKARRVCPSAGIKDIRFKLSVKRAVTRGKGNGKSR
ncbi:MAG: DciA family protein [Candidatus Omnitrophota bacterium]|jgi:predicted nucleic acid-binding Zn ribbon protein